MKKIKNWIDYIVIRALAAAISVMFCYIVSLLFPDAGMTNGLLLAVYVLLFVYLMFNPDKDEFMDEDEFIDEDRFIDK